MRELLLFQQMYSGVVDRQFVDSLELLLQTYTEVLIGFLIVIFVCFVWLVVFDCRQKQNRHKDFSSHPQNKGAAHLEDW